MRIRALMLAIILPATIVACGTLSEQSAFKPVAYTCASAAAALNSAAELKSKMTPAQISIVSEAAIVLNPVCSSPEPPTVSSTAQAALAAALTRLTGAVGAVQK